MKRKILCFLFALVSLNLLIAETMINNQKKINLYEFYENPFNNRESFPRWFDDYLQLKSYYSNYEIEDTEILNKYTQEKDKEITIKSSEETFIYYLRSFDGKIFRTISVFDSFDNLKHGFNKEMTTSEIIKTCGEKYNNTELKNNYDLQYNLPEGGTIHFLIDKSTKKLYRIVFMAEL